MKREYLSFMCCPECQSELEVVGDENERQIIETGSIKCVNTACGQTYPIVNSVPRFVTNGKYANSFGQQWRAFAKTQLDGSQTKDSQVRWDSEVTWNEKDIAGKTIIEFGSGAGRFMDVASKLGVKLAIGIDITDAVDASQDNLGKRGNCFFIQADFFKLPIKRSSIDFGYSIGVLHHTPNPERAFYQLVNAVSEKGSVALGLYDISLYRRPNRNSLHVATMELLWAINAWRCEFFRFFTTRLPPKSFLIYCKTVVPVLHYLNKIPVIGLIRYLLPSTCYKHMPVEWSMVDTHDTYVTQIVHQYRAKDVFQWFLKGRLYNIVVTNGRAGWISIVATKDPSQPLQHDKYIRNQPYAPGLEGSFIQGAV